jgi:3-dehydroquinate synthase
VLTSLGLPVHYRTDAFDDLMNAVQGDKKTRGQQVRFVLLRDLADPVTVDAPPDEVLRTAYARLNRAEVAR